MTASVGMKVLFSLLFLISSSSTISEVNNSKWKETWISTFSSIYIYLSISCINSVSMWDVIMCSCYAKWPSWNLSGSFKCKNFIIISFIFLHLKIEWSVFYVLSAQAIQWPLVFSLQNCNGTTRCLSNGPHERAGGTIEGRPVSSLYFYSLDAGGWCTETDLLLSTQPARPGVWSDDYSEYKAMLMM